MKKTDLAIAAAMILLQATGAAAQAYDQGYGYGRPPSPNEQGRDVGGATMLPYVNIMGNISKSFDHSVLLTLIRAAHLEPILESPGPITLLAPTNAAFNRVPPAFKPQSERDIAIVTKYHILRGRWTTHDIQNAVYRGGGRAVLETLSGRPIMATLEGGRIVLTDARGGRATIIAPNIVNANGVIQVIDTTLIP
jgi:uncharacterized surface protein with fasciclin (FAS1) repeats